MTRRSRFMSAAAALVLLLLGAALLLANRESTYDRSFDTSVAEPAYAGDGPLVIYDEGHRNSHAADGAYKPFADLLQNDGYRLRVTHERFTEAALSGAAVVVSVCARGSSDTEDDPAFTEDEAAVLESWVRAGGGLLLVTDHWPYGTASAPLAQRFGVTAGQGLVEDPTHCEPSRGASHIVFAPDAGLLDHPIVRGRNPGEQVRRVLTFTGQSLLGPPGSLAFLTLSDAAVEYPPGAPRVLRDGSDVRVEMEYGAPVPAAGRAQGLCLELGEGRFVALGEAGMLRAQKDGKDLVGMNVPGYDNKQLARNIVHWLSRCLLCLRSIDGTCWAELRTVAVSRAAR